MNWALVIHTMAPEHLLLLGIVATVLTSLGDERPQLAASIAIVTALAAAVAAVSLAGSGGTWVPFPGHFSVNPAALLAKAVVLGLAVPVLMLTWREVLPARAAPLLLGSLYGTCLMLSADSFLTLFVGLELMSLPVYVLVLMGDQRGPGAEAALKYLVLGGAGSATLLMGAALLFGATGSLGIDAFTTGIALAEPLPLAGAALVLLAFFLKAAIVPLHAWAPDAYQGASLPVTAYMATIVKAGALLAALRLFGTSTLSPGVAGLLLTLPLASMVWGNLTAMRQDSLRRMLAYSSIAHAGYLYFAFVGEGQGRFEAVLFYLIAYGLMNVLAFAAVPAGGEQATRDTLPRLQGLYQRQPFAAIAIAASMLSLAGIPPLPGFVAKFLIFRNVLEAGYTSWAVAGLVASYLGIYFYLRVIQQMFMATPAAAPRDERDPAFLACALCLLPAIGVAVFPGWVLGLF